MLARDAGVCWSIQSSPLMHLWYMSTPNARSSTNPAIEKMTMRIFAVPDNPPLPEPLFSLPGLLDGTEKTLVSEVAVSGLLLAGEREGDGCGGNRGELTGDGEGTGDGATVGSDGAMTVCCCVFEKS